MPIDLSDFFMSNVLNRATDYTLKCFRDAFGIKSAGGEAIRSNSDIREIGSSLSKIEMAVGRIESKLDENRLSALIGGYRNLRDASRMKIGGESLLLQSIIQFNSLIGIADLGYTGKFSNLHIKFFAYFGCAVAHDAVGNDSGLVADNMLLAALCSPKMAGLILGEESVSKLLYLVSSKYAKVGASCGVALRSDQYGELEEDLAGKRIIDLCLINSTNYGEQEFMKFGFFSNIHREEDVPWHEQLEWQRLCAPGMYNFRIYFGLYSQFLKGVHLIEEFSFIKNPLSRPIQQAIELGYAYHIDANYAEGPDGRGGYGRTVIPQIHQCRFVPTIVDFRNAGYRIP